VGNCDYKGALCNPPIYRPVTSSSRYIW